MAGPILDTPDWGGANATIYQLLSANVIHPWTTGVPRVIVAGVPGKSIYLKTLRASGTSINAGIWTGDFQDTTGTVFHTMQVQNGTNIDWDLSGLFGAVGAGIELALVSVTNSVDGVLTLLYYLG
jgi:hypothetical protein